MKSTTLLAVTAIVLLVAGGYFAIGSADGNIPLTVNVVSNSAVANSGNVQAVKMRVEGGKYILEPSTFKKGQPVRIEGDISQMPGCSKSVVISAFGIRKSLSAGDNVIEFTPDRAGTFNIACSMNMYRGTFTILDSDGSRSSYVQAASTSAGSCGGTGSGCGCGG